MRTADWTSSVTVLDRVTAVFDAFGEHDDGLGVSELARRANLPKSTVSRIAADLVDQRLLDREGDKLYLGVRLFELGQTVVRPRMLRQVALPVMADLRHATGLTVHLGVLEGSDVVVIAIVRAGSGATPMARVGGRLPAHATALGKALLAFSPQQVVNRFASGRLAPRTPDTITEPSALLRELPEIRRIGWAAEQGEFTIGGGCTASAILASDSTPLAAMSVTGSIGAVDFDRLGPLVQAAAMAVSRRFGASRLR